MFFFGLKVLLELKGKWENVLFYSLTPNFYHVHPI